MKNPMSLGDALELLVTHKYSVEMLAQDRALIAKKGSWIPDFFWISVGSRGSLFVDGDAVCRVCHAHNYHPSLPPQRV